MSEVGLTPRLNRCMGASNMSNLGEFRLRIWSPLGIGGMVFFESHGNGQQTRGRTYISL